MTITKWIFSLLAFLVAGCTASKSLIPHSVPLVEEQGNKDDRQARILVPKTFEKEEILWEGPLKWHGGPQPPSLGERFDPPRRPIPPPVSPPPEAPPYMISEKELRDYQKAHGLPATGRLDDATKKVLEETWSTTARNPPIISIGRPRVSPLLKVLSPEKISPLIRARLDKSNFYLVQLFCAFRPIHGETWIQWARFEIYLLGGTKDGYPIAHDLIPTQVTQKIKRHTKFILAPSLKFQEVEIQGGSLEGSIEYEELEPTIIAAGEGETIPTWTYQTAKGISSVNGGKRMYLIVEAPKNMTKAYAQLALRAQIRAGGIRSWFDWHPPIKADGFVQLW